MDPNIDIATRFLRAMRPRGPWTLTTLHPDRGGAPTETWIGEREIPQMREWIALHNTRAGIYFTANPTKARMHRRPCEDDIAAYQYAALDFDPLKAETPAECRKRVFALLRTTTLPPTFVWSTGNGIQCLWRCKPAVMLADNVTRSKCKTATLGLIQSLEGADATQSLEHVFRVAGTVNHPNANKRAAGRTTILAGDFQHWPERAYELAQFPKPKRKGTVELARGLKTPIEGWDTSRAINDGLIYLQMTEDTACEGRSGTGIRTALRMRDHGVSEEAAFQLMWTHWVPRCEYQWEEEELRGKVRRAYALAQNDPGCRSHAYRLMCLREDFADE